MRSVKEKIENFHFDEIVLILLILTSDLSKYDQDLLSTFDECIEGRIEVLFTKDFLFSLNKDYGISDSIVNDLVELEILVTNLYESGWFSKLAKPNHKPDVIKQYATKVLDELNIRERDPKKFLDEHFEIDW